MIIAITGTYNDLKLSSIRGNGKTLSAVFLAYKNYQEGQKIYTNFYTTFSEVVTLNQLVEKFKNKELQNTTVILDEAQIYLSNSGVKASVLKEIIGLFIAQTRKQNVDIILTVQRFKDLHLKLRTQTDIILIPIKYHIHGNRIKNICYNDSCKQQHIIGILNLSDNRMLPYTLRPETIGKLYNSNEIVLDEFIDKKEVKK